MDNQQIKCKKEKCSNTFIPAKSGCKGPAVYCSIECRNRQTATNTRNRLKEKVYNALGNKCSNTKCGFSDIRALQIDHINGGGVKELKSYSNRMVYLRHVLRNIKKYQILCANCNWIKRAENKEHT